MRLLFCTHATDNGGSDRSLFVLARQLARIAENPAISGMAGRNAAAAAMAFFHPVRNAANIERLLTGQDSGHA